MTTIADTTRDTARDTASDTTPPLTTPQAAALGSIVQQFRNKAYARRCVTLALNPGQGKIRVVAALVHAIRRTPLPHVGECPVSATRHVVFKTSVLPHNGECICVCHAGAHEVAAWRTEFKHWGLNDDNRVSVTSPRSLGGHCSLLAPTNTFQLLIVNDADLLSSDQKEALLKKAHLFSYIVYVYSGLHRISVARHLVPGYHVFTDDQIRELMIGYEPALTTGHAAGEVAIYHKHVKYSLFEEIAECPELIHYLSTEDYAALCLCMGAFSHPDTITATRQRALETRKKALENDSYSSPVMRRKLNALLSTESLELQRECAICYEVPEHPVLTACGHVFCPECIFKWLGDSRHVVKKCPICRVPLRYSSLTISTTKTISSIASGVSKAIHNIMHYHRTHNRVPWNSLKNALVVCPGHMVTESVIRWKHELINQGYLCHDFSGRTKRATRWILNTLCDPGSANSILFIRSLRNLRDTPGLEHNFDKLIFVHPVNAHTRLYSITRLKRLSRARHEPIFIYDLNVV